MPFSFKENLLNVCFIDLLQSFGFRAELLWFQNEETKNPFKIHFIGKVK